MSRTVRPFEVVFLTNFSDSCFRAIPGLAQLGDVIDLRLTILHAYGAGEADRRQAEQNLRSFFPEADHYASCRRVLAPGTAVDAVKRLAAEQSLDLIVAPAGDPLGLPRLGHKSIRSRLVTETRTPVWTLGRGTLPQRLARSPRHVACCVETEEGSRAHIRLASQYARSIDATLHLIRLLPDIHEGSILDLSFTKPFDAAHAAQDVQLAGGGTTCPEAHLIDRWRLARTLTTIEADIVFVDGTRWMNRGWFMPRVDRMIDSLPCPTVCVDSSMKALNWHLPRTSAHQMRVQPAFELAGSHVGALAEAH
jgi:hypothetical protein